MALLLIVGPIVMALVAFLLPSEKWRPWLLPVTALAHLAASAYVIWNPPAREMWGWLWLDAPGRLVLGLVSVLFAFSAFYAVGYVKQHAAGGSDDDSNEVSECRSVGVVSPLHHSEAPSPRHSVTPSHAADGHSNRIFCMCMLGFLAMMSLVAWSHHLGLMWVAVEATTLVSAPLIYFNRNPLSLEATWKYLLICSVGIALALLGSFFLAYAFLHQGLPSSLMFDDLVHSAKSLSKPWLHAAFVLLVVGYGTKMGLAPMHTWLPDAHSEAPTPVSALLSGALLPCAFLAILRVYAICSAAGDAAFARRILLVLGLLSMAFSALFLLKQADFKRMLAYSSVEHMGILAVGIGLGGAGTAGSMLHMLNHGLAKCMLFLAAGNLLAAYGSKRAGEVSGAISRLPLSGTLFALGFVAITGSPPFGPFVSEFTIASAAMNGGSFVAGTIFLLLLAIVFVGMGRTVLLVVQGRREGTKAYRHEGWLMGAPLVVLFAAVLMMGIYIPRPVQELLNEAARFLGAQS